MYHIIKRLKKKDKLCQSSNAKFILYFIHYLKVIKPTRKLALIIYDILKTQMFVQLLFQ